MGNSDSVGLEEAGERLRGVGNVGTACHRLGLAMVVSLGLLRRVFFYERIGVTIKGELSLEVTNFFFFGFWCAAMSLHSFE